MSNQFGGQNLRVLKRKTLCMPSEKDGLTSALNLDHFRCYSAGRTPGTQRFQRRFVSLEDQFGTKDSLLLEYGAQVTQELSELRQTHRGSAAKALHKMLIFLTEHANDHADIVRLFVREVMAHPVALADATEQSRDLLHLMSTEVRRGQHTGEFLPNVEPRLAAGIIVAAYFAIVTEWVRCEGEFNLVEAVQQSFDIVLNGLATKRAKK